MLAILYLPVLVLAILPLAYYLLSLYFVGPPCRKLVTGEPFVDLDTGLQRACESAEIKGVTWHTLRHTFASRLLDRGVDIMTVKELLGHSTVTVTMRYTHSNLASKVSAVGKLGGTATILLHPAPKCSSSNPGCSKMAANSQNTLELKTEE